MTLPTRHLFSTEDSPGLAFYKSRKRAGLTQKSLAKLSGVSANKISDIENDKGYPSMSVLLELFPYIDLPITGYVELLARYKR